MSALDDLHNALYSRVSALVSPTPLRAGVTDAAMPFVRFNDENQAQQGGDKTGDLYGVRVDFAVWSESYNEARSIASTIADDLAEAEVSVGGRGTLRLTLSGLRPLTENTNPPRYGRIISITTTAA